MKVSRRDFLKISAGAGAAATFMNKSIIDQAMAIITQNRFNKNLVWIKAQGCEGCTISALQWCGDIGTYTSMGSGYGTNLLEVVGGPGNATNTDLEFHPTLMPQSGVYHSLDGYEYDAYSIDTGETLDEIYVDAMQYLKSVVSSGTTYVVVEGAIPYENWGDNEEQGYCVLGMYDLGGEDYREGKMKNVAHIIKELHEEDNVEAFIALGNCSSFGGIAGGNPNPTGAKGLQHFLEDAATSSQFGWISPPTPGPRAPSGLHKPVFNLSGCPASPDHLILVYAAILKGGFGTSGQPVDITLDQWNRPETVTIGSSTVTLYDNQVHDNCERREAFDVGSFATDWADALGNPQKCLLRLGCRGPNTFGNCSNKDGYFGGPGFGNNHSLVSAGWNPKGVGFWNKDRHNTMSNNNSGSWCIAAGAPCNGCTTTTFPDNVFGNSFFMECKHSQWLATGKIPGDASGATPDYEGQGIACYTCHAVSMPRKNKEWIENNGTFGYGSDNGGSGGPY